MNGLKICKYLSAYDLANNLGKISPKTTSKGVTILIETIVTTPSEWIIWVNKSEVNTDEATLTKLLPIKIVLKIWLNLFFFAYQSI